jgi:hypothetical protein
MIAAHLLEVHDDDLEWDVDRFRVKCVPEMPKTMTELAFAAYNNVPPGMEPRLEAVSYYDPPNMTYPIGAKGVGGSPNVGGVSAFSNAVNDAFAHLGLTHTQMPYNHWRVWKTAHRLGLAAD